MKWLWLALFLGSLGVGYYFYQGKKPEGGQPPAGALKGMGDPAEAGTLEVPAITGAIDGGSAPSLGSSGPLGDSALPKPRGENPGSSYGGPNYHGTPPAGGGGVASPDGGFQQPPPATAPNYEEPPMYEQLPPPDAGGFQGGYDPNNPNAGMDPAPPPPPPYEPPPVDDYVVPPPDGQSEGFDE